MTIEAHHDLANCPHEELAQVSEVMLRWTWERQSDGTYAPRQIHDKVLHEETVDFTCKTCGVTVFLTDDLRIDEEVEV